MIFKGHLRLTSGIHVHAQTCTHVPVYTRAHKHRYTHAHIYCTLEKRTSTKINLKNRGLAEWGNKRVCQQKGPNIFYPYWLFLMFRSSQAGLELGSSWFSLQRARILGVRHRAWLSLVVYIWHNLHKYSVKSPLWPHFGIVETAISL